MGDDKAIPLQSTPLYLFATHIGDWPIEPQTSLIQISPGILKSSQSSHIV